MRKGVKKPRKTTPVKWIPLGYISIKSINLNIALFDKLG